MMLLGAVLLLAAVASLGYAVLGTVGPRVPRARRRAAEDPSPPTGPSVVAAWIGRVNGLIATRAWFFVKQSELDAAGITRSVDTVRLFAVSVLLPSFVIGRLLFGSAFLASVLSLASPFVIKLYLRSRASSRRKAFAGQLDQTLRIIASALRAGQSLPAAMASVALDTEEPMRRELGRVVNEARVGRDLVVALRDTAARMRSDDLLWFAEAVDVQRDTGGNLNDIIDTVAETIRDRAEIREKVNAYASEGKASAFVLMALPVALAITYSVMNPGYLSPLFNTGVGIMLLLTSVVMYTLAFFWMRAIVNIKV